MTDLTLYTNPRSRGSIARWMMEEVGQPYTAINLDFATTMKAADYIAINPMKKVPALVHNGQVVTECAAICCYMAETFPDAGLLSPNRAAYYRWMFFGAGPLEHAVTNTALKVEVPKDRIGMVGYGTFDRVIRTLTGHLAETPYFCGQAFSAVDVYVGKQIGWGLQFGILPADPVLTGYWDRISARPAHASAAAADAAALAEGI